MRYEVYDNHYDAFTKSIKESFALSNDCIYTGRNQLKVLVVEDQEVVVKSFRVPHLINKIAYTFLRDSKAARSYKNSIEILDFVPKPIGYAEYKRYGLIHESYFICEKYAYDFTIREVLKDPQFPYREEIFLQFASFTFALHNEGVKHLDYSPGNILIKKISQHRYEFKIVDVNRMIFKNLSDTERLENFSKLWASDGDLKKIVKAYASYIQMSQERAVKIALEASQKHKDKKHLKNKVLKYVRKKRPSGKNIENIKQSLLPISVVLMVKNAENTIQECLDSLLLFDEVILYLNNSTDRTEEIALRYENVKIVHGDFLGFGKTKNHAATYSKNDWILSLDSDEILNKALLNEIASIDFEDIHTVYKLKRDNYFLGYKTQLRDVIVRIYNRQYTQFNDNSVHEKIIIPKDAKVIKLKNSFKHLNITEMNQTLTKMIQYTDLSSQDQKICYFSVVIAKSMFAFVKVYILKGNFLRGWIGFTLGVNAANRRFYKYIKQFINCKQQKASSS